jgi:hypothetical protein
MLDYEFPEAGRALFIYLAVGMLLGAALLGLLARIRNHILMDGPQKHSARRLLLK